MPRRILENMNRLGRECRGSQIAEAAAVLPLMFMMLLGIFWFGQAFRIYGTITYAAREGARAAVAPACATCAAASTPALDASAAIQNALLAAKLDPNKLQPGPLPSMEQCSDGKPVTSCSSGAPNICVLTNVELTTGGPGTGVCGVSVSFQYPYQFWLPFTTLNMQLIQLRAQSRIRLETR